MTRVLVVDDSAIDRYVAGTLLEEHEGWIAEFAEDGRQALAQMQAAPPDLVLTDMQMPEINGLELVEAIRRDYPAVPVILMTAHGSEDIAGAALQLGASSYVPKRNLARDLIRTVENVLNTARTGRHLDQVIECLAETECRFVMSNDPVRLQPLIGYFLEMMAQLKIVDGTGLIRVGTALHEALVNAIEHGNLELRPEMFADGDRAAYQLLVVQRREQFPFRERRLHIYARFSDDGAVFRIRDEGPGFDTSRLPDPTNPANLESLGGRGLLLIRTFMDEVRFNATGNEITLVKRRKASGIRNQESGIRSQESGAIRDSDS